MTRAAWLEIDLAAYRANLTALRAHCGTGIVAVVKANAYGHGLIPIARAALAAGVEALAVALPEEGAALREGHVQSLRAARILILGLTLPEQAPFLARYGLEPTVSGRAVLPALSASSAGRAEPTRIHVKVDTGMGRIGVTPEEAPGLCQAVAETPGLQLGGLATHFASAEDEDLQSVQEQWERFAPLAEQFRGRKGLIRHAANSAAALWFEPARLDWIRPGLVTYGIPPAPRELPFPVRPVLALKARVAQLRDFPAGAAVGYGGTWRAERPSRLALAPVGYGDGYPWNLGNRAAVLIQGQRAPVRGRVSMDQIIVDVTDIPGVRLGEEVVLIGRQSEEEITVRELAELSDTCTYELLTRLNERLPRVYRGEHSG